ncbi:MAG: urea transporter [Gammaproteobacteria bacterium]|nr:urea transporter [Gammaproteobacteria bacterium]MBU1653608.1 urea transporter [Gammaproteobacteria bacterium]MBU1960973.1 urea transporter [Gammaproteobacteria bacterium]
MARTDFLRGLTAHARAFFSGYSAVVFTERPAVGALCFAATGVFPRAALGGLGAVVVSSLLCRAFALPEGVRRAAFVNALLTGLTLGLFQLGSWLGLATLILAASTATWITAALAPLLWRAGELPVLSLPFTLALWLWLPIQPAAIPAAGLLPAVTFAPPLGDFLKSLGWIFLSPHPLAGVLVFAALTLASRWLAWLAVTGFTVGYAVLALWAPLAEVPPLGFNFILAALTVGGIYAAPGLGGFLLALFAAALAAPVGLLLSFWLTPLGLYPFSAPFVAASLLMLSGARLAGRGLYLSLAHPALPEQHAEALHLESLRLGPRGSVPLAVPFLGEWQIYQGFDGAHTHRGPWRHGLDFFIVEGGRSFAGEGLALADYHAFGLPVLSPAAGEVVAIRDGVIDNPPGEVNTRENWGNYVLIRTAGGAHVLLAHLRQGSLAATVGAWVKAGDFLGACGSSGRSPQPHLHLHVQDGRALGSPTRPFHLINLMQRAAEGIAWWPAHLPAQGDRLGPAHANPALTRALTLPAGRRLYFETREDGGPWHEWEAETVITLTGQTRLAAAGGASAAFVHTGAALAFFDRDGPADPWLDLLLLAVGLTPLADARQWRDSPPARLFPAGQVMRVWLWLTRPLGAFLNSSYQRAWQESQGVWRQSAVHCLTPVPGRRVRLETLALIAPQGGITHIAARSGPDGPWQWEMRLTAIGQSADEGIPAWRVAVQGSDDPRSQDPNPDDSRRLIDNRGETT